MSYWITYADIAGQTPDPLGASHPSWGLYDVFETADGWLFVGVTTDRHWPAFCEATGLTDLETDDRFATATARRQNQDVLIDLIQNEFRSQDRSSLLQALNDANVPVAPVNDASDLIDDPGLEAADLLANFSPDANSDSETQAVLAPIIGERFGPTQYRRPPAIGEHTQEVLAEAADSTEHPPEKLD
jgi:crotonobetainyl-CoA:carnitine CoA-transferase CaiB-like acyl-CoA transferase